MTPRKLPYGLKLHLIKTTGETYHNINRVLNGTSTDLKLMEQVNKLLAQYNQVQESLNHEIEAAQ